MNAAAVKAASERLAKIDGGALADQTRARVEQIEAAIRSAEQQLADVASKIMKGAESELAGRAVADALLAGDALPERRINLDDDRRRLTDGLRELRIAHRDALAAVKARRDEQRAAFGAALRPLADAADEAARALFAAAEQLWRDDMALRHLGNEPRSLAAIEDAAARLRSNMGPNVDRPEPDPALVQLFDDHRALFAQAGLRIGAVDHPREQ
ncbi:MAG: hypothetical protein GW859_07015 [Sphingomonadales bacterium]|nr:hypothetical protein [Sphingomonadales bacterium]